MIEDLAAGVLLFVAGIACLALVILTFVVILALLIIVTCTACGVDPNELFEPIWDRIWPTRDEDEDYDL